MKEGIKPQWMQNIYKVHISENDLRLSLCTRLRGRGDTLNSGTLTVNITSPMDDVISVKSVRWMGEEDHGPNFQLNERSSKCQITEGDKEITVTAESLTAKVITEENNFSLTFLNPQGEKLTGHSSRSLGFLEDEKESPYDGLYREGKTFLSANLDIGVGEKIYGLGERFGPFVKNGQTVEIFNEDGGTSSEMAYKNIPFYMTSKGYGVFVRNSGRVSFEIQSERTTRCNISLPSQELEYIVIYGPSPKDILEKYTALTGRPQLPPSWSYHLWLSTSFTTSYNESTVNSFLDGFAERKIPLGVFHFDCFWMRAFEWCNFEFDKDMFPDAKGQLKRLKERNLNVCVWINSYIGQESPLFAEGKKEGFFIKRADTGGVWQWDEWQAGMAVVDFTNPKACVWYQSYLSKLIDMGVTAFKTDFGERIPFRGIKYYNNTDPERMHNYYTLLYNRCVQEVLDKKLGKGKGCLFARSATSGSQTMPVHWGGDCETTFEAMAETLRGGLSFGLSGFGFWAHDIGGFEGTPPASLYKRWVQFGLLSSHSRLHGSGSYRVPWVYGDEACLVLKKFTELKISLIPYLFRTALDAKEKGTPVLRAMLLEFPADRNVWSLDQQYMLGPNLLVAPIFNESGRVSFYVPECAEGKWTSWWDGKKYEGGKWYDETHDFMSLPVLVRPNTLVPTNILIKHPSENISEDLEIIFGDILESSKFDIVDGAGVGIGTVTAKNDNGKVVMNAKGLKSWRARQLGREGKPSNGGEVSF